MLQFIVAYCFGEVRGQKLKKMGNIFNFKHLMRIELGILVKRLGKDILHFSMDCSFSVLILNLVLGST
jgi:hypothetical protein